LYAEKNPNLPQRYKKWLEEEVVYIITSKEEKVFKQLETDKQRDLFMEEFWRQRDPTPGTPQNEFKDEHYRRIEYANRFFSRGTPKPGWKTERGRVYIILGEPIYRQEYIDGRIYPIDLWFYQGGLELESFFYILFFKRYGAGDYKLYSPLRDGPPKLCIQTSDEPWDPTGSQKAWNRFFTGGTDALVGGEAYEILYTISIDLAQASLSLIPGGSGIHPIESDKLLGKVNVYPQKKVADEYAYEFLRNKATVEVSYSVHYIGNTSIVKTFQDEHGLFFVHYSIQPQNLSVMGYKDKYYSNFLISGRVTDLDGKTVFQYNREYPIDFSKEQIKQVKMIPMAIQDSFPLVPGNYKFNLLLQNTVSKEFTSLEREIIIPESREAFWMGDLVFAFGEEKDKESLKSSFKVEETRLYPCLRKEFTPQDTLYLFFQLYGLSEELKEEGWIKYTFLIGEKQQYERKRKVVEYMDAMNFLEEFPLQDFPPSSYIIRVSVLDRDGREALFREERFSVLSKIHARPWIQFKRYPGSGDPVYSFTRGRQWLNRG
ncbi:MAG: GWxTD domain-containing protein, partial [Candidatus Aminicenantes bacterium]|nr:GWxTD domain-containing protein [Candidatus Aminicenantes bacterium]